MKRARAFTLIELLVVVVIIGALIAILVPSLGKVRETARRAVCGTNLKSQGTAFAIYAQQNNDFLPAFANGGGYWMHDQPWETGEALLNMSKAQADALALNSMRKWFYCPSNPDANVDALWNYGVNTGNTWRAHGYSYLNNRRAAIGTAGNYPQLTDTTTPIVSRLRTSPPLIYRSRMVATNRASEAELALDEILSRGNIGLNSDFNVPPPGNAAPSATSHLKGKVAAGANTLTFDGHVVWRNFPTNVNKVVAIQNQQITPDSTGTGSFAWVIDP